MKKICVGIPHTGLFNWQTLTSLLSLQIPPNYTLNYHLIGSCLVYDAREKIVQHAKDTKSDYILMLDSDMVPPADMVVKMIAHMERCPDMDAVTGMAFKRTAPFQPCFYSTVRYNKNTLLPELASPIEWPADGGLLKIEGAGMACMMLRTSVFDRLGQAPYFFPLPNMGEDLTCCLKMKAKGMQMYVDLTIDVGHVSQMPIYSDHFKACYEEKKNSGDAGMMFMDAELEGDKK